MITRKQYFALTKLDSDGHTALKHRGLVPFPSAERNAYTLFDAFTYLIAEDFASSPDGQSMTRLVATNIVRDVARQMVERRDEIVAGAELGSNAPIHAGRITRQFPGGTEPFCGTAAELFSALTAIPMSVRHAATNVSLTYAVLRERCRRNDVAMDDIWPDANTIPPFEDRRPMRSSNEG